MATPTPPSIGPNIGTSRLLNVNNLQQAADSFTKQLNKLTASLGTAIRSTSSSGSNSNGGAFGSSWNSGSNRSNYGNGGNGRFTVGSLNAGSSNGGGGRFGSLAGMSRLSAGAAAIAGTGSALINYANKNMASNFQLDYFGTNASVAGGIPGSNFQASNRVARATVFNNNNVALNATDAAKAGYLNQYTFGNSQFNGVANPAFVSGQNMSRQFAYANPTAGAYGGALAAQQTYSGRSLAALNAYGYGSPISMGGVKNSMGNIAQGIYGRTFGNQNVNMKQFNAAIQQGGSLAVNLQAVGASAGWSQSTIQSYQNVLQGQVAAQQKGMGESKYYSLLSQAAGGNRSAVNQLAKTTGMGSSMFENQRNLNATRLTRQNDILDSLAPAFDSATKAVDKFSRALTSFLQSTGLDKAIGATSGYMAPFSNALGGLSGGFGAGLGLMGAARFMRGGGGLLGGLFGRGAGAAAGGGLINAGTAGAGAGAGGASVITSMGGAAATGGLLARGAAVLKSPLGKAGALGVGGWALDKYGHKVVNKTVKNKTGNKWANGAVTVGSAAATGAAIGTIFGPEGTLIGGALGAGWGLGEAIFGGATGEGGVTGTSGNSARNSSVQGAGTASAAQIIKYAETQLGVPYVWGGEQPGKGFDCSGLTHWAYGKAGVKIPRIASDQQTIGTEVPTNKTQPGDLLFQGNPAHHVVMAIGDGKIIEAPHPGAKVTIRHLNPSSYTNAKRIVGSIGNLNSLLNENGDDSGGTLGNKSYGGDLGTYGTSEAEVVASALAGSAGSMPMAASAKTASDVSGSGTGGNPKATGSNEKAHLKSYAKALLAKHGWSNQWASFDALEMSEAGWNVHATNPQSGAYGLAQALPASKYTSAGKDWKTSGETQLRWMMDYIADRYKSPNAAWSFHQKNNWYAAGAWNIDKDQPATVHKGEMIIPAQQAETIRQTLLNNTYNPNLQKAMGSNGGGQSITFGDIHLTLPNSYGGTPAEARDMGKTIVNAMEDHLRLKNLQIGQ